MRSGWRLPGHVMAPHAGLGWVLVLEVAIACLLWQLAWQTFAHWREQLTADSGIEEQHVLVVAPLGNGRFGADAIAATSRLLARIDGVQSLARVNQVPYGANSWNTVVRGGMAGQPSVKVATTFGDASLPAALGLRLQEGRNFRLEEYESPISLWQQPGDMPVLITHALAQEFFPGQHAVGRLLHGPTRRLRVVGVVAGLPIPNGSREPGVAAGHHVILPAIPDDASYAHLLVRVAPGREAEVATSVQRALVQRFDGRPIAQPIRLADLRPGSLQAERRCAWTLALCALAWSLLTLLSLASAEMLWVQRSASRISLHRALGASRAQVRSSVHWDLLRLALVGCGVGLIAGTLVAPRLELPWQVDSPSAGFALAAVAVTIALSQALAAWPARRAADVAPHHVTRKPWVRL